MRKACVVLRGQADPDFNQDCSSGLGFQPDQNRKLVEELMRFDVSGDFSAAPVCVHFRGCNGTGCKDVESR